MLRKILIPSLGFFLLFMGLMSLMYLVCALRTNIVFVAIFTGLTMVFLILTGSYWCLALGETEAANKLQVVAGAFGLMAVMAGWWHPLISLFSSRWEISPI